MTEYAYYAINENGTRVNGTIDADNLESAAGILSERGYIPIKIKEKKSKRASITLEKIKERLTPVNPHDLILFTKQFRTLLRAGVPILTLFQALENQTENERLRNIIVTMSQDVREGASLYDAFRRHKGVFSPLYCSMIQAGEASGALTQILDRLIYLIEHEHKIKSEIRSAMVYPLIVIIFLVSAIVFLLTFVVPRFVSIFQKTGLELPLPTIICLKSYEFFSNYLYFILFGTITIAISIYIYCRTDSGRFVRDTFFLKLPILGQLFLKAAMSRFSSIFSILQSSGITVLESMKILRETINNEAIAREFDLINERLEQGRGIAGPLRSSQYFTPIVISMVAVGEESGNLDEMLREVSLHYDSEMEYALKKMTDSIGPVLTLGLAAVVGFFALAIYLPMWDLTQMAK